MQKASQAYVQTQITTVSQGELLLLLYDGALKFLGQAKEKIQAKDYVAKGNLISKALDIINELDGSLNEKEGGDLARNLHQLYFMCSAKLLQANLRMDIELIDVVINVLAGLRSAYAQIIANPDAKAAAAKIASRQSPAAATVQRATPLPQQTAFTPGVGRSQVNAAYGQQSRAANPAQPAPQLAAPFAPGAMTPKLSDPLPRQASAPAAAPAPASGAVSGLVSGAATAVPASAKAPSQTPAEAPAPSAPQAEPTASAPLGMLSRRLAASSRYGKMSGA